MSHVHLLDTITNYMQVELIFEELNRKYVDNLAHMDPVEAMEEKNKIREYLDEAVKQGLLEATRRPILANLIGVVQGKALVYTGGERMPPYLIEQYYKHLRDTEADLDKHLHIEYNWDQIKKARDLAKDFLEYTEPDRFAMYVLKKGIEILYRKDGSSTPKTERETVDYVTKRLREINATDEYIERALKILFKNA